MSSMNQNKDICDDAYELHEGDCSKGGQLEEDYENLETFRAQTDTTGRNKQEEKLPGAATTEVRCYKVSVVSLGLLCVLLLAVIIWMVTKHTADQQQRNMDLLQLTNLTRERNHLKGRNTDLTKERDHLQARNTDLTKERDHLQARNTDLTKERDHLQARNTNLTEKLNAMLTRHGWESFGSSIYRISTNQKNWTDSRQECMDAGGHLVIIDSEEEQKFITGFKERVWIGLSTMESPTTWKWVNGKVLGDGGYWALGEPNNENEDCAEIWTDIVSGSGSDSLKNWNDSLCHEERMFVCEKKM